MKPLSYPTLYLRQIIAIITLALLSASALAQERGQTMLVINSYCENTPWSQSFAQPINKKLATIDDVHLEMINLNSANIKNEAEFKDVCDKIFDSYSNDVPEYVIMIGNFAFCLRDRIKKEWGDVPILLISRIDRYAPLEYYFAGYTGKCDWDELPKIADIRYDYNMTMIETPDFCKESVDYIASVIHPLKKIVFISDDLYPNRSFDLRLRRCLEKYYPNIEYEWLQAGDASMAKFQDYMLNKHEHTGFLISSWAPNPASHGMMSITGGNLPIISSAANPVFSLRDSYLSLGAFGGVYHDLEKGSAALIEVIDRMIDGEDMRSLDMYLFEDPVPIINHQRMLGLGYTESDMPNGTHYIFRAPTVWETHQSKIIAAAIILLILVVAVIVYMSIQGKRITLLKTHVSFIKNMPWAYSKAKILYDINGKVTDIEYMLDDMNSAFMRLLTDNLLPKTNYKIFPYAFIAEKTQELVDTHLPVTFTYHFERTDSYYEVLLCRINPTELKPGERPKFIDIFANDISKRIRAQEKLSTAMRTLDMTLSVARIIPWQWDVDNEVIYYEGFRTLRSKGHADGKSNKRHYSLSESAFLHAIHLDDFSRMQHLFNDFRDGKRSHVRTEFKVTIQRSGKIRTEWVEINATVSEVHHDNRPKRVIGSLLIISDRKHQEEALILAKERASESDRMKSAFLANMSHEIRTPLNAIVGFSSLIAQTDDPEEKLRYAGIIEHNNDLLLHLINDVLDLAKIESNTLRLQTIDTDINDLMRSIYDTVRLRIASGVVFNMVLGSEECNIKTDPNRLSQILINLLTNAAKFTIKGSITYGYEINDSEVEFFVRDTGIGISKENQKRLFKRFSKLNNFVQGTGLGLSICKSFIEKMGGSIGVKSRGEGKGATFWFTLPYIKADKPKLVEVTEGTIIESPINKDSDEITILVAEDNDSNYTLFDSILSKYYKLIHAHNGQEAIEMFKQYNPQLILMDIRMPDMDGYQATEEIRAISDTVPIIAVTAHAFVTEKDKIMNSGFNGYVSKPINQKELLDAVKTQLSKRFFVF